MKDLPNEPGLWQRDGVFYRVWNDGVTYGCESINPDGRAGTYFSYAPRGNWQKVGEQEPEVLVAKRKHPEVIEGKGQPVTGVYAWQDGPNVYAAVFDDGDTLNNGMRYIRLADSPTFPPRKPPFVAPPKPELVLVRWRNHGLVEWITEPDTKGTMAKDVEILEPTTGEPIAKGGEK